MIPELEGYVLIFRSTHRLFHRSLEGVTADQAKARPDGTNPIHWIAGHIVTVRNGFLQAIGGNEDIPWAKHFARGGEVANEDAWPSLERIREKWDEVHEAFLAKLEQLTTAEVLAPTEMPGLNNTLLGVLGLAALHDSYHVGQLASARRRFGLERVVG